jgi:hypothetical protein
MSKVLNAAGALVDPPIEATILVDENRDFTGGFAISIPLDWTKYDVVEVDWAVQSGAVEVRCGGPATVDFTFSNLTNNSALQLRNRSVAAGAVESTWGARGDFVCHMSIINDGTNNYADLLAQGNELFLTSRMIWTGSLEIVNTSGYTGHVSVKAVAW